MLKIVSPDILHKTDAGGVARRRRGRGRRGRGLRRDRRATPRRTTPTRRSPASRCSRCSQSGPDVQEVIIGAVTDPTFGKIVAFGLGGVLVEVLKDVTFRLAPTTRRRGDGRWSTASPAAEILNGVRGAQAVDKDALAGHHLRRCPTWSPTSRSSPRSTSTRCSPARTARPPSTSGSSSTRGRRAARTGSRRRRSSTSMNRIMKPKAIAVIGASNEDGKIGNSVMKNLINGGYQGEIYPINPKADEVLGLQGLQGHHRRARATSTSPCSPSRRSSSPAALEQCGEKGVAGAILIPSGFAETGNAGAAGRGRRDRPQARRPDPRAEHLRLLLHAREPLRDVLHAVRRQGRRRAVVAERRHRDGDPRLQPVQQDGCLRDRRVSATSPTSTRTTC